MTDEQRKLVEDNHNLIYSCLRKNGWWVEEYYDVAAIALCNAAMNYNPDHETDFPIYAYSCMMHAVFKVIDRTNRLKRIPPNMITSYNKEMYDNEHGEIVEYLESFHSTDNVENDSILRVSVDEFMNSDKLSDRDRDICKLFILGYNHTEIAKMYGCSRQNVSMIKMKFKRYLEGD